jgi:hypothetical protein
MKACIAFGIALVVAGCSRYDRSSIVASLTSDYTPWHTTLASLPPDVRLFLVDHFDSTKELRKQNPGFPAKHADEIVTDARRKFEPGCTVLPGFASILFVRAKPVGAYWVVEYEYGGFGHGSAVMIVARSRGGALYERDQAFLDLADQSTDAIAAALAKEK